ncbi:hypothetical protein GGR55DRAFT_670565 [Xylaria sp. FL0064]|nr:hypothetical protein GGR55DRAFT_670565 [Xylaria sp. FL0064]
MPLPKYLRTVVRFVILPCIRRDISTFGLILHCASIGCRRTRNRHACPRFFISAMPSPLHSATSLRLTISLSLLVIAAFMLNRLVFVTEFFCNPTMALSFSSRVESFLFAWYIVLGAICISATVLRFVATLRSGRKLDWENWFALAALLCFVTYAIISLTGIGLLASKDPLAITSDDLIVSGKLGYATVPFYPFNQLFTKFSILFLYYRLFSVNIVFVRWMYVIGVAQIGVSLSILFTNLFTCTPISRTWDSSIPGWCLNQVKLFTSTESINSFIDFAMIALACFMVSGLQLKRGIKWKLGFVFALGGFAGAVEYIRIGLYYHDKEQTQGVLGLVSGLLEGTQQATSIICCCAPTYKNVLPHSGTLNRFWSQVSSFHLWSTLSGSLKSRPSQTFRPSESIKRAPDDAIEYGEEQRDWEPLDDSSRRYIALREM